MKLESLLLQPSFLVLLSVYLESVAAEVPLVQPTANTLLHALCAGCVNFVLDCCVLKRAANGMMSFHQKVPTNLKKKLLSWNQQLWKVVNYLGQ